MNLAMSGVALAKTDAESTAKWFHRIRVVGHDLYCGRDKIAEIANNANAVIDVLDNELWCIPNASLVSHIDSLNSVIFKDSYIHTDAVKAFYKKQVKRLMFCLALRYSMHMVSDVERGYQHLLASKRWNEDHE